MIEPDRKIPLKSDKMGGSLSNQRSYLGKNTLDQLADDFKMKYKDNWEEIKVMIDNHAIEGFEEKKSFEQVAE